MKRVAFAVLFAVVTGCQGSGSGSGGPEVPSAFLLKDIAPGNASGFGSRLTLWKGKVYFAARDPEHGTELWVTDGTAEGTQLLRDIYPGPEGAYPYGEGSSEPSEITSIGDAFLFEARDSHGSELWFSDGTTNGTRLVVDLDPRPPDRGEYTNGSSTPYSFVSMGTVAAFSAKTPSTGRQMWRSDGTAAGTCRLTDNADPDGPTIGTGFRNQVAFINSDSVNGREVWLTDGTREGTRLLIDAYPGLYDESVQRYVGGPKLLTRVGDRLLFRQDNGLWSSDGTAHGSGIVARIRPIQMEASGDRALLYTYSSVGGEIWQSDGTAEGTRLLVSSVPNLPDIRNSPSDADRYPYWSSFSRGIVFGAWEPAPAPTYQIYRAWITDGTAEGTRMLKDLAPGTPERAWTDERNRCVWFTLPGAKASNWQIWRTDGTRDGTRQVGTFEGKKISSVFAMGDLLLLGAETESQGHELWALKPR